MAQKAWARFPEFEDRDECDEDRKALREENEEMFRILKSSKIIYVDNPPLVGRSLKKNKEIREESRKRLLTYLATCQNIYHPANLAEFKKRIDDYQTKSEQLEKELSEIISPGRDPLISVPTVSSSNFTQQSSPYLYNFSDITNLAYL